MEIRITLSAPDSIRGTELEQVLRTIVCDRAILRATRGGPWEIMAHVSSEDAARIVMAKGAPVCEVVQ